MVGGVHGGCSLSDALSAGAARAGGIRGVSRGVRGVARSGDRVGRGAASVECSARGGAHGAGGVTGADVAAGGPARHCARVSGDASGWSAADPARSSGRPRNRRQGSSVGGVGGVGPQRAAHDAGRDPPRVASQRVCDCVASAGEAAGGCAGLRGDQGSCRAGGAGRVPLGSTQSGGTAPPRPQPRRPRIAAAAENRPQRSNRSHHPARSRRRGGPLSRQRSAARSVAMPASFRRARAEWPRVRCDTCTGDRRSRCVGSARP
ncbi:MAG: hypothetical protein QOF59_1168 [Actinomycetota bacterium]|nr:hypothetical protein [Actinomycetota bacterium]